MDQSGGTWVIPGSFSQLSFSSFSFLWVSFSSSGEFCLFISCRSFHHIHCNALIKPYSAQILMNSSRWWAPKMEESLVRDEIKKRFFLGDLSQICLPTHLPQGFVRFGRTKGEIRVEKGDFRGDLGGFWGVWTLFGSQPPHPPTFGRDLPKKNGFFFWQLPLKAYSEEPYWTRSDADIDGSDDVIFPTPQKAKNVRSTPKKKYSNYSNPIWCYTYSMC